MDIGILLIEELQYSINKPIIGAGIGALGSGSVWAYLRYKLQREKNECNGDPICEEKINEKIRSLNRKAALGVAGSTIAGAVAGKKVSDYGNEMLNKGKERGYWEGNRETEKKFHDFIVAKKAEKAKVPPLTWDPLGNAERVARENRNKEIDQLRSDWVNFYNKNQQG